MTLAQYIANLSTLLTSVVSWVSDVVEMIASQPVLLVLAVFGIISVVFGIVLSFVRRAE